MNPWLDSMFAIYSIRLNSDVQEFADVVGTYDIQIPQPYQKVQDRLRLELTSMNKQFVKKELDKATHLYTDYFNGVSLDQESINDRFILEVNPYNLFFKKSRMFYREEKKDKVFNNLIIKVQPDTYRKRDSENCAPISVQQFDYQKTEEDRKQIDLMFNKHRQFFKKKLGTNDKGVINGQQFKDLLYQLKCRIGYDKELIR